MKPIRIDGWSTCLLGSPYQPPEARALAVSGRVAPGQDPRRPDGSAITTSAVKSVDGRTFTTASGTRYVLGAIDPKFRRWLRKEGRAYDPAQPIVVKVKS